MTQTERRLIEKLEEYVSVLGNAWNLDIYPDLLKKRKEIAQLKQQVEAEEKTDEARLKEELIKFMEFQMQCSTKTTLLSDDKFIDEYLKHRTNGNNSQDIH